MTPADSPPPSAWGTCSTCAGAVPPGAALCPQCAGTGAIPPSALSSAPRKVRRRVLELRALRVLVVVGAIVALAAALVPPALSGPPSAPDPLTTRGLYTLLPSAHTVLSGEITGGDYIVGNFTTVQPAGTDVTVSVYNTTAWEALGRGETASPAWSIPAEPSGRIVYSASYTDTYYFVFANPYPVASGISVTLYVATNYESNVATGGFA